MASAFAGTDTARVRSGDPGTGQAWGGRTLDLSLACCSSTCRRSFGSFPTWIGSGGEVRRRGGWDEERRGLVVLRERGAAAARAGADGSGSPGWGRRKEGRGVRESSSIGFEREGRGGLEEIGRRVLAQRTEGRRPGEDEASRRAWGCRGRGSERREGSSCASWVLRSVHSFVGRVEVERRSREGWGW